MAEANEQVDWWWPQNGEILGELMMGFGIGNVQSSDENSLMAPEMGMTWPGLCLWMFHAIYHFLPHAVLFLRIYHLQSCTSLVPSMGRSRPNWNVTFVQVHPLLLNFFNHSLSFTRGPESQSHYRWVPSTSQASDGRLGLVHTTRPTRSIPFRRHIFRSFSLGLIFMWRLNKK